MHSGQICKCTHGGDRKGWAATASAGVVLAAVGGCSAWQRAAACTPGAVADQRPVAPLPGRRGQEGAQAARVSGVSAPPCAHRVLRLLVQHRLPRGCHGAACGGQRPLMEFGHSQSLSSCAAGLPARPTLRDHDVQRYRGLGGAQQSRGVGAREGGAYKPACSSTAPGTNAWKGKGAREARAPPACHHAALPTGRRSAGRMPSVTSDSGAVLYYTTGAEQLKQGSMVVQGSRGQEEGLPARLDSALPPQGQRLWRAGAGAGGQGQGVRMQ